MPAVTELACERRDPFQVLVSTVISLRTKDAVTGPGVAPAAGPCPDGSRPGRGAAAEIAELIYPAGFYRTKAASCGKSPPY